MIKLTNSTEGPLVRKIPPYTLMEWAKNIRAVTKTIRQGQPSLEQAANNLLSHGKASKENGA